MSRRSNYDKFPSIRVPVGPECVWQGWRDILLRIGGEISRGARCISVEIYPGVFEPEVLAAFVDGLHPAHVFRTSHCWKTPAEIDTLVKDDVTDDPVFGRMSRLTIEDFADPSAALGGYAEHRDKGSAPVLQEEVNPSSRGIVVAF